MKRLLAMILLLPSTVFAQSSPALTARMWRQQHERAILDEFLTVLAIPNVASDREGIQRNASALTAMMQRRGIAARLVTVGE